jgi:hypothetical protein
MARQRTQEPESLLDLKPTLPVAFAVIIRRLMAKDPADRPATAAEVVKLLNPWVGGDELPLDRKEDPEYSSAVIALRDELAPGLNSMDLRMAPVEDDYESELPPVTKHSSGRFVADRLEAFAAKLPTWKVSLYALVGIIAAFLLMGFGAALVLLFKPH